MQLATCEKKNNQYTITPSTKFLDYIDDYSWANVTTNEVNSIKNEFYLGCG